MRSSSPTDVVGTNVILTGFMGTGKTTVGRLLAELLGFRFVDTDQMIIERHGSIPEIFAEEGEAGFRTREAEVARELSKRSHLVVSTGGRLMLDAENAAVLGATGTVFCLTAPAEEVLRRVLGDQSGPERPLLAGNDPAERIRALLVERAPLYAQFNAIDTNGRTPVEIAAEIVERLDAA